jgi:mitotic spindle assembly checkpoint protein MAD2
MSNIGTQEPLERWDFKIEYEAKSEKGDDVSGSKDIKVIQKEIGTVLKQICSSISFLPLLDCPCSFELLIYAAPEAEIPEQWGERGPCFIANSEEVQLRSFSTSIHRMNTVVSYKAD